MNVYLDTLKYVKNTRLYNQYKELAKKIIKQIKDAKLKVDAKINDDIIRVTGKKRDDLQATIALVRGSKIEQPLQYENFRD